MTAEAQRFAMEEACGWRKLNIPSPWKWVKVNAVDFRQCDLPDYLNDLNAIHEALNILTPRQREVYAEVLHQIAAPCVPGENESIVVPKDNDYIGYIEMPAEMTFKCYHATAAQRAEALLRTINKWDDTK